MHQPNLPLAGLRVLDFSSMLAGPYCGRWLSDLGAEVIKVESPEGDYMRSRPPLRKAGSTYFGHLNAGKKSVVLDLKNPEAKTIARKLVANSDVLIEGFRPGVMARMGLDYASLQDECPGLVYCSISGWGQQGPRAQQAAYAAIVHAAVGFDLAWQQGQIDGAPPPECAVQIADVLAATFAVMGVQSALLSKAATGRGMHVDVSLAEGMLSLMPLEVVKAQFHTEVPKTSYRAISAADGEFVVMPLSQKNFEDLCVAILRPNLKVDSRFNTSPARVQHWEELRQEICVWARSRTAKDCVDALHAAGVPATVYGSVRAALTDEQLVARGFFSPASDSDGSYLIAGLPFSLGGRRWADGEDQAVPALGQHTREVLKEQLDISDEQLDGLASAGLFGQRLSTISV